MLRGDGGASIERITSSLCVLFQPPQTIRTVHAVQSCAAVRTGTEVRCGGREEDAAKASTAAGRRQEVELAPLLPPGGVMLLMMMRVEM